MEGDDDAGEASERAEGIYVARVDAVVGYNLPKMGEGWFGEDAGIGEILQASVSRQSELACAAVCGEDALLTVMRSVFEGGVGCDSAGRSERSRESVELRLVESDWLEDLEIGGVSRRACIAIMKYDDGLQPEKDEVGGEYDGRICEKGSKRSL